VESVPVAIIAEPYEDVETINSGFKGANWKKEIKLRRK